MIFSLNNSSVLEIYKKQVGGTFFDEILSFEEMERRCWELYYAAKNLNEKLRALSQLRMISQDKMKLLKSYPTIPGNEKLNYPQIRDDLKEFDEEGDSETNPS